jgi:preprotein translocase subunit SecF
MDAPDNTARQISLVRTILRWAAIPLTLIFAIAAVICLIIGREGEAIFSLIFALLVGIDGIMSWRRRFGES